LKKTVTKKMEATKQVQSQDQFPELYDQLAIFFGGDALCNVLNKRFDIYWDNNGINYTQPNMDKAVLYMKKKANQISKCEPGFDGYYTFKKVKL